MEGPSFNASTTKYKGVRKRKWGKWVAEIRLPNSRERIWLGSYDSPEKAARAFDAAQFCLRGRNARFNFPEHPPNITGGRDLAPAEIQVEAARFANSGPETPPTQAAFDRDFGSDYGIFPGFDDLNNDYFVGNSHHVEENYDGVLVQEYRLWNFE